VSEHWSTCHFNELDAQALYDILQLRLEVFALEQACLYQDLDGLDPQCLHMQCRDDGKLLAYQRCLPPGLSYPASSLGRIVVAPAGRGRQMGRELVRRGIECNRQQWPDSGITIGAQAHLEAFYASFGFVTEGEPYDEDGILHITMHLRD
jgi:ElaA protein